MGESRQSTRAKRASMPPPEAGVDFLDQTGGDRHATSYRRAGSEDIRSEARRDAEWDARLREASPGAPPNGSSAASLYAPSRFSRRLVESRPKFTVVGDSIMEEGSIDL